jgi:hypothetical protein
MEMSGQLCTLAALPQGKSPQYQLDRLYGPQSQSSHSGEEIPIPARNQTPAVQPVA